MRLVRVRVAVHFLPLDFRPVILLEHLQLLIDLLHNFKLTHGGKKMCIVVRHNVQGSNIQVGCRAS